MTLKETTKIIDDLRIENVHLEKCLVDVKNAVEYWKNFAEQLEFQLRDKTNSVERGADLKDIGHYLTAVFYDLTHGQCKSPYDEKEQIKRMIRSYSTSQMKKKEEEIEERAIKALPSFLCTECYENEEEINEAKKEFLTQITK